MWAQIAGAVLGTGLQMFGADKARKEAKRKAEQAAAAREQAAREYQSTVQNAYGSYGQASNRAARDYASGVEDAYDASRPYYDQARSYLRDAYTGAAPDDYAEGLTKDIIGRGGEDGSSRALAAYEGSPDAILLERALADVARREADRYGAMGMRDSGAFVESLGRRTADLQLGNYQNWRSLAERTYDRDQQTAGRRMQAGGALADLAERQGGNRQSTLGTASYLRAYQGPMAAATAGLTGTMQGANAITGMQTENANAMSQVPGRWEAWASPLGQFSQQLQSFAGQFPGTGGGTPASGKILSSIGKLG